MHVYVVLYVYTLFCIFVYTFIILYIFVIHLYVLRNFLLLLMHSYVFLHVFGLCMAPLGTTITVC